VNDGVIHESSALARSWDGLENLFHRMGRLIGVSARNVFLSPSFLVSLRQALETGRQLGFREVFYTDLDNPVVVREIKQFCRDAALPATMLHLRKSLIDTADVNRICELMVQQLETKPAGCVFFSHIDYRLGAVLDVNKLIFGLDGKHLLLIDAAHSVGQMPLQLTSRSPILILGTGHKWLGGSRSSAFLALAGEPTASDYILKRLIYESNSAFSHIDQLQKQGSRHEYSSVCEIPLISLGIGIRKVNDTGIEKIRDHVLELVRLLRDENALSGWKSVITGPQCGICFLSPRFSRFSAQEVTNTLRYQYKIAISAYDSEPVGIRVCINHQNTAEDVRRLIDALCNYSMARSRFKRSSIYAKQA
jgi:selenocysteine lyase/cysteine desulfurase